MDNENRVFITISQAESMLPDGDTIHSFRQSGTMLIGADLSREHILELIATFKVELSGPTATSMKHGMVLEDNVGLLFIQTKDTTP